MGSNGQRSSAARIEGAREAVLIRSGAQTLLFVVPGPGGAGLDPAGAPEPVDAVVAVSRLPRTSAGEVDVGALLAEPLIDEAVRARAEALLASSPGVREAAVVLRDRVDTLPFVHPARLVTVPSVRRAAERPTPGAAPAAGFRATGPLALADGGPPLPGLATLPQVLRRAAEGQRATTYIADDGVITVVSHATLLADAERVSAALGAQGVSAGDAVLIAAGEARAILTSFWGVVLRGAIPAIVSVPRSLEAESGARDALLRAHELLRRPLVIAEGPGLIAGARVLPFAGFYDEGAPRDGVHHAPAPEDTAVYNLTSGSTGQPKCIELSHRGLLSRARGTNVVAGFGPDDRVLSWLPFDHIGSISDWHLRPLDLGSSLFYASKEYVLGDPLVWLDLLSAHRITGSWAPNFAFQLLVAEHARATGSRTWDLSQVSCLLTAGESVSRQTVHDFTQAFARHGLAPHAVVPAFGMAELGSGVTYARPMRGQIASFHERDGASFADLGPPIPGCKLRVLDADGQLVPERVVGQVQIGGTVVSKGYLRATPEQALAYASDGWFDTGDRGFLADGRLVLTGRSKDVIIVNGANYYAHEIEAVVESEAGVEPSFAAAFAVRRPDERLAILYVSSLPADRWAAQVKAIRRAVVSRVGINPDVIVPVSRDRLPKTAIGKIMRSRLRDQVEAGLLDERIAEIEVAVGGPGAVPDWFLVPTWAAATAPALEARTGPVVFVTGGSAAADSLARTTAAALAAEGRHASVVETMAHARAAADALGGGLTVVSCAAYGGANAASVMTSGFAALPTEVELVVVTGPASERTEAAAVAAWSRALTAERTSRRVELDGTSAELEARALARELRTPGDPEVKLDASGGRWVPRLVRPTWPTSPRPVPLAPAGFYVVTGGGGGLGQLLVRELVEVRGMRVLSIQRRAPSVEPASPSLAIAIIDLSDAHALEAAIAAREAAWGPLAGVFHLAGVYRERVAAELTAADVAEVFDGKARGNEALLTILSRRPAAAFVGFSSLAATFGGARLGAYAAANAVLDATARRLRAEGRPAWAIGWSAFADVGLGREAAAGEGIRARGYLPISPARGLASLWAVMTLNEPVVLVGADRTHPELRWRVLDAPVAARELAGFAALAPSAELPTIACTDAGGVPAPLTIDRVEAVPRTATGEVDVARLLGREDRVRTPPRTEVEVGLAELWRAVLSQPSISREDDFFALGGHSLLATQLVSRVRDRFGVTVPLGKLFEATTLERMADVIDQLRAPAEGDVADLLDQVQHLSPEELEAILAEDAALTAARPQLESSRSAPALPITAMGIITANRPLALERALDSYLENLRDHGRDIDVVVTDDSRDEGTAAENRARMKKLQDKYGLRLHHGWVESKRRFVSALTARTGAPQHVVHSSFMRGTSGVYACGVNRNSFQMAVVGEAAFLADDDTMCRLSTTPSPQPGVGMAAGSDAAQLWFYADREEAVRSVPASPGDLIGLHEAYLGRTAGELRPEPAPSAPPSGAALARLSAPSTRVRLTVHGLLGDTGWAVPFGQWGAPMGYLLLDDASRARLVATPDSYKTACVSRQIMRVMDRVTLTDATYSMSTFWAFDNTTPLVPHLVSMRGADLIFGAVLWETNPDIAFAHLPTALFHAPIEKREFHMGELIRTAMGFDTTRMFINMVRAWPGISSRDPEERLRQMGRWMMGVGAMKPGDFWAAIAEQGRRAEDSLLARIEGQLARHGHAPKWWADDLMRYTEALRRSISRDEWFHPLDVRATVDSDPAADALTQKMVIELGEMMTWWPDFFRASLELRREGLRLVDAL